MTLEEAVKARLAQIQEKDRQEQSNLDAKKSTIAGLMADHIRETLGIDVDPCELSVNVNDNSPAGASYVYNVGFRHLSRSGVHGFGLVVCDVHLAGWPEHPSLSMPIRAWQAARSAAEGSKLFEFNELADAILYATGEIK